MDTKTQMKDEDSRKIKEIRLNSAQKEAVEAGNGSLLIVAGAGTGKTRTLTHRIVRLIEKGIKPERICAITFTNKAANEMANRVENLLGKSGGGKTPLIGTFHSLGARILRKECRAVGRAPNFTIFDDHDSFDLIKKSVKAVLPKEEDGEIGASKLARLKQKKERGPAFFSQKISRIKNIDGAIEDIAASPEKDAHVKEVFERYESELMKNNAFDFDDLIEKVVQIFKKNPAILEKYQNMFDVILVDEYQDINPKQYELVSLLAKSHGNLCVVGDDEQTIYSWRYANIETFLGFDKMWPEAKVYFLEENYRSTGTIIRAAASVSKHNRFRAPKNLWTQNSDGDPITIFEAWGENEEAEWIANNIEQLQFKAAGSGNKKGEESTGGQEIAVLYRTNAQSRAIEQALIRHAISYRIWGGLKFYERREIKDAVAGLRYIANPKDTLAKERLEKNLTKRKFAAFASKVAEKLKASPKIAPLDAIKIFTEAFGYFEYLEGSFINAEEREDNIVELISFASEFTSLDELLERLSLLQATDTIEGKKGVSSQETIHLMTIHMAKGLEFDTVFIAGAAEGLLPHGRSLEDETSLEEERRLMYVAMTRARKNLCISFYGIPSRFLSEIPEDCTTFAASGSMRGSGMEQESDESDWEEDAVSFD